jgi:hypothetical protein
MEQAIMSRCDYIVVSAADTWMLDVELIYSRVSEMQSKKKFLFTCPW